MTFAKELEQLLNRHSMDNHCNTPDFLLAEYLVACLGAYKGLKAANDHWHRPAAPDCTGEHWVLRFREAISAAPAALIERTAQIAAHRACCGTEHDAANGKLHGYCVVCGVPWPCQYAGSLPSAEAVKPADALTADEIIERCAQACGGRGDWRGRECADAIRALKGSFADIHASGGKS